ncbi:E3 ubiquitin-protein ligase TRIM71-like [Lineus longissimus]|uniref:E3 ubiquitin-protein ligase TRIM71-like n=1 Tax=Lineus longissimus TaxID=88925 RepID=UPI002B4FAF42
MTEKNSESAIDFPVFHWPVFRGNDSQAASFHFESCCSSAISDWGLGVRIRVSKLQFNMAATAKLETQVCLICLEEAEHLKVVGECEHAFCEPCLRTHLKESDSKETFLSCPSCHCDCSIPAGGVGALPEVVPTKANYAVDEVLEANVGHDDVVKHVTYDVEDEETTEFPLKDCTLCNSKDQHAPSGAKRFCEECDVYLCEGCSAVHGQKSGTKSHILTVVGTATRSSAGLCGQHDDRPLKMFCQPCATPCCGLCVANDHGDHDVCPIRNMLDAAIFRLEKAMEQGKSRVNDLDIKESTVFSTRNAKLEWKMTVIRTVEKRAEECVNNILKQKENLLKTICDECETSAEEKYLCGVARIRREISTRVDEGARLISCAQADPKYLKRLSEMEDKIAKELVSEANVLPEIDMDCTRPISFLEESDPVRSIGSMTKNALLRATKVHDLQTPTEIEFIAIPEVRCLGELGYAAICRQEVGVFPDQLVIFDKDGELKIVEQDLPKVIGMDVDAQDRTVLLLPGKKNRFFLIRVYDTKTVTSESTKEFLLPEPLSMTASPEGFYVLSEGPGGNRIISAIDTTGNITESTSVAYPAEIRNHNRIACSSKYIYTIGSNMSSFIATFRMIDRKIMLWDLIKHNDLNELRDISVTLFDRTFVLQRNGSGKNKRSAVPITFGSSLSGTRPGFSFASAYHYTSLMDTQAKEKTLHNISGVELGGTRIHVQNHNLLWTNNKEILVYKLQC